MYIPARVVETRPELLWRVLEEHNFGTLISVEDGRPRPSHLPFLREGSTIVVHMARENDHWKSFAADGRVIVKFPGPHAYISPAWYPPSPRNVPTWNYVTVHVHGTARIIEEPERAFATLEKLVTHHEDRYGTGWTLDRAGAKHLLTGIVAFEVCVERLEGKLKLSQHQPAETPAAVAAALEAEADTVRRGLGAWMAEIAGIRD